MRVTRSICATGCLVRKTPSFARLRARAHAKGFGPAFQAKVLAGIELLRRSRGQRLIHHAAEHLSALEANVRRLHPELSRMVPVGDVRPGSELVSDLALVREVRFAGSPCGPERPLGLHPG